MEPQPTLSTTAAEEEAASPVEGGAHAGARILVAEDQSNIAKLIQRMVASRLGAEVTLAPNGDTALELMDDEHFDILVTDMMMPGVHGLDLVRRAAAKAPDTAIIVMTGHPREFPYVDVIQAGARDFINKPFPALELEAKLVRILKEQALYREQVLADSKYRSLFEFSGEGMLLLDCEAFRIADVNSAFCAMTGFSREALAGRPVFDLFEERGQERARQVIAICTQLGQGVLADMGMPRADGRRMIVDINLTYSRSEFDAFVFLGFRDMTERRAVEQRLVEFAQKDELTGLYNRRAFQHRMEGALVQAREHGEALALILIDLDNFKACNDTHGHQVGDRLLVQVGNVLRRSTRQNSSDRGFRCGGDEFAMILQRIDAEQVQHVASRLQTLFSESETFGATMSIGIATYAGEASSEALFQKADKALYRAKARGKNVIEVA